MKFLHYSKDPFLGPVKTVSTEKQEVTFKPRGFWFTDESEENWYNWCQSEKFQLDKIRNSSEVILKEDANILWLDSPWDIEVFTEEYKIMLNRNAFSWMIDWSMVAQKYSGIVIMPYQWSCRLDARTRWYYGWDCSSGCVWDPQAIKEIRYAGRVPVE